MALYKHMLFATIDNKLHSYSETKAWYLYELENEFIDIEDYPTFESYFDGMNSDMQEPIYDALRTMNIGDFSIYELSRGEYIIVNADGSDAGINDDHI